MKTIVQIGVADANDHLEEVIKIKYKDEILWNADKELIFKECNL